MHLGEDRAWSIWKEVTLHSAPGGLWLAGGHGTTPWGTLHLGDTHLRTTAVHAGDLLTQTCLQTPVKHNLQRRFWVLQEKDRRTLRLICWRLRATSHKLHSLAHRGHTEEGNFQQQQANWGLDQKDVWAAVSGIGNIDVRRCKHWFITTECSIVVTLDRWAVGEWHHVFGALTRQYSPTRPRYAWLNGSVSRAYLHTVPALALRPPQPREAHTLLGLAWIILRVHPKAEAQITYIWPLGSVL